MTSQTHSPIVSRREMLQRAGMGFGSLAFTRLLADDGLLAASSGTHFSPRVKSVICLFMGGGPSQVDTFDPKPDLDRLHGKDVPESIAAGIPRIARSPLQNLFASPFKFAKHGQCGMEISELFPHVAKHADELCLLRSMRHDTPIHAPAEYMALTGTQLGDRPSLGAWVTYGLGSENKNLPGFVVFLTNGQTSRPPAFGNGFLPSQYQGTRVSVSGPDHLSLPEGATAASRQQQLKLAERLNRRHLETLGPESELEARILSYELAFRMQMEAPHTFDLSGETAETHQLYGVDQKATKEFGTACLLARRLVEQGVRFIQIRHGGWDAHSKLQENHSQVCQYTDQPIAALITDLKRRGLLDETLLVWGGEFGRTPTAQAGAKDLGRDHSPSGYCMWLAGGKTAGGRIIGSTDAVGYSAIERPIHPSNLHATILQALGLDQYQLKYRYHGRDELVTVNGAEVIQEVWR